MEPVKVWAVRLSGLQREVEGTLELVRGEVVFTADDGSPGERIPIGRVRKVRRIKGSPVLVIRHETDGGLARTAFYFAKPPPLEIPEGIRKKKVRRQALHYLEISNVHQHDNVKRWKRAIERAVVEAGD